MRMYWSFGTPIFAEGNARPIGTQRQISSLVSRGRSVLKSLQSFSELRVPFFTPRFSYKTAGTDNRIHGFQLYPHIKLVLLVMGQVGAHLVLVLATAPERHAFYLR